MAKRFKGFTPEQQYTLLAKMGYSGPKDPKIMEQFVAASPQASAKMGEYGRLAQERLNKKPTEMQVGGLVTDPNSALSPGGQVTQALIQQPSALATAAPVAQMTATPESLVSPTAGQVSEPTQAAPAAQAPTATTAQAPVTTPASFVGAVTATGGTPEEIQAQIRQREQQLKDQFGVLDPTEQEALIRSQVAGMTKQVGSFLNRRTVPLTEAEKEQEIQRRLGALATQQEQYQKALQGDTQMQNLQRLLQTGGGVKGVAESTQAAQGQVSDQATAEAAQGKLSPEAMAVAAKVDPSFIDKVSSGEMQVGDKELATPAGQAAEAIRAEVAQGQAVADAVAQVGVVTPEELPEPAQIQESEMAQAEAITMEGLAPDATVIAARLEKFSVDNETLAKAVQGEVGALDTVQGQLSKLMQDFNDGTPAWAAGAIRAANAAMASRGLGGSSMAGAAIVQAAMESAVPIAAQDAQVFQQMNLQNLSNRQQVALANAAAQQGLQLQNLNNEQQAALQNSANAFALQSQNLSNMQSVVLANAQIKSALQGQNLSNRQQSNLAVAARYAEQANLNLNNRQQTALQNNMNAANLELANLSAKQQAYITNANLAASLQGQQISNEQQTAITNAARFAEAANINFTTEQQTKLHNSTLMQTVGLAELNTQQAATLQNAANLAQMDMANLNNRQQAAVQNAQAFLDMDMANLNNEQQTELFRSQSVIQALFTDQAAENAAQQFNAASQNQVDQFFADLSSNVSRFNADQMNAVKQFNAGETNATERFNAQLEAARNQFNAQNSLVIAQANAQWRQNISTLNTAALNDSYMEAAKTTNALTAKALDELWQKERDAMAYAFQAYDNEQERNLRILLADKNIATVRDQMKSEEDTFKMASIAKIVFGDW